MIFELQLGRKRLLKSYFYQKINMVKFNDLLSIYLLACLVILLTFLSSADFFQGQLFSKKITGIPSER